MDETLTFLARYADDLTYGALSSNAVREVKRRLIDSLGCALGAYRFEPPSIARAQALEATGTPGATVLGTAHRSTAELAAFANGVMIRYLDFNDMSMAKHGGGHPSDMIAGVLAAAEYAAADPSAVITGIVLSYEVMDRLADECDISIGRGWDYATWIAIGSAYGASKALGLSREQTANAVAIAAVANVSLFQTRRGALSMWKGSAGGNGSRNGVFAALLAKRGMTAPAEAFNGESGFFRQVAGGPISLPPFGGNGRRYKIEDSKLKAFPADYEAQSAVHPALKLHDDIEGRVDAIESVDIVTYGVAIRIAADTPAKWAPTTRETADHSIPYLVAVALTRGDVGVDDFSIERIRDTDLRKLMAKIRVRESEEFTRAYPESTRFRLELTTRSGDRHVAEVRYPKGHPKNAMTDNEVEDKFRRQAVDLLPADQIDAVLETCWNLEQSASVGELMTLLALPPDR